MVIEEFEYFTVFLLLFVCEQRMRRRRSPRALATSERRRRGREARERDREQLARSLERIHRKRRTNTEHPTDADLKQTYTGLDR